MTGGRSKYRFNLVNVKVRTQVVGLKAQLLALGMGMCKLEMSENWSFLASKHFVLLQKNNRSI